MRTAQELALFCDEQMQKRGKTIADLCRDLGFAKSLVTRWKGGYVDSPKLSMIVAISEYLNIPLEEVVGVRQPDYPDDIRIMLDMLKLIKESDRAIIFNIIKTYYDAEIKQKETSVSAG